jgi:membrane protease YdiL (CAAX protease family)
MTLLRSRDLYSGDAAKGWMPWGALAPFLALAFLIATQLTGTELVRPLARLDAFGNPLDANALVAFALVPFGLLMLILLAWVRFVERRPLASVGLRHEHPVRSFLRGHAIGMSSIAAIVAVIWLAGGYTASHETTGWSSPSALLSIFLLLAALALQSSAEELLFRGWLLSVLTRKFNVVVAVMVSSLLFSFLHFSRGQHWLATLGTLLFGVFACAWALRSRSILGVMGWHSGWNWLLASGFGLPLTGLDLGIPPLLVGLQASGPDWLTGGAQGPEASAVCLVYFTLSAGWLFLSRRPAPVS